MNQVVANKSVVTKGIGLRRRSNGQKRGDKTQQEQCLRSLVDQFHPQKSFYVTMMLISTQTRAYESPEIGD